MDEVKKQVSEIVGNAPNWSFEHDLSLLDLMKTISENLETRCSNTTEKLKSLRNDVETTSIDLDNTANSLRALHFGQQYVESRCLDDDDDVNIINANATKDQSASDDELDGKSAEEILGSAFAKTLKVFDKYHEKQALYIEDSDDDDDGEETEPSERSITYVYHAKNPYNDRLLPHIYGSKLWSENWHVGLLEEEESSDKDEENEEETPNSNSSQSKYNENQDTQSLASTNSQFSDWSSNPSLSQPPLASNTTKPIKILNPVNYAGTSSKESSATSKTSSESEETRNSLTNIVNKEARLQTETVTPVKKTPTEMPPQQPQPQPQSQPQPQQRHFDLFGDIRTSPPSTPTISNKSQHLSNASLLSSSSNSLHNKTTPPSVPPVDFLPNDLNETNPATASRSNNQSNSSSNTNSDKNMSLNKTLLRKPINLFDDDDFNNFMTEINNKVQSKSIEKVDEPQTKPKEPSLPKTVDLFASSNEENEDLFSDLVKPKAIPRSLTKKNDQIINKKVSDESLDSPSISTVKNSSKFTTKSLFDDDDDEDFLNVFSKKPKETSSNKPQLGKTLKLFDDLEDEDLNLIKSKEKQRENNLEQEEKIPTKDSPLSSSAVPASSVAAAPVLEVKKLISKTSLFDSDEDDDSLFGSAIKKPPPPPTTTTTTKTPISVTESLSSLKKPVKSLFNDSDDEDDLFGKSSATKAKAPNESSSSKVQALDSKALKSKETPEAERIPASLKEAFVESQKNSNQVADTSKVSKDVDDRQKPLTLPRSLSEQKPESLSQLNEINSKTNESKDLQSDLPSSSQSFVAANKVSKPELEDDKDDDEFLTGPPNKLLANVFNKKEETKINSHENESLPPSSDLVPPKKPENSKSLPIKENLFGDSDDDKKEDEDELFKPKNLDSKKVNNAESKETLKEKEDEEKQDFPNEKYSQQPEVTPKEGQKSEETFQQSPINEPEVQAPQIETVEETLNKEKEIPLDKPAASSFPAGVFSEEPPDDDDASFSSPSSNLRSTTRLFDDFYESNSISTTNNNKIDASNDVTDYKNIFLFNDLPPDDEFESSGQPKEVLEASSKRLHSIFYDDFHETKEAIKQNTSTTKTNAKPPTNQHGFFNDEPPSDEDLWSLGSDKLQESSPVKVNSMPKSLKSPEVPLVSSNDSKSKIESLKAKLQESPKDVKDSKMEANVSKLKLPKMEINVKALIPAGPGKSFSTPALSSFPETSNENISTKTSFNAVEATPSPNENILSSLCKNRVRPPATRKPSSRAGRKENYRKSMQAEEHENKENLQNEAINENRNLAASSSASIAKSNESTIEEIKPPEFSRTKLETKGLFSFSSEEDLEDLFQKKPRLNKEVFGTPENNNPPLITNKESSSSTGISETETKADHLNQNLEKPISSHASPKETISVSKPQESLKKNNNNGHDSMSSTSKSSSTTITSNSSSISSSVKSSSKSLFADSSSDSDNGLFKTIRTSGNKTNLKPTTTKESNPQLKNPNVKKNVSLFGSSDSEANDENDSIFNKSNINKPLNKTPIQSKPSKGLFSDIDSDDDDDDLFGTSASKKATKANTTTTIPTTVKSSTQTQAKLPTAAATTTKALHTQKTKTAEIKKTITTTTTTKDIKDNPLADLL